MYRWIGPDRIEWSLNWKGQRIRKRELAVNDRQGRAHVEHKAATIRKEMALGTFDPRQHFSGSTIAVLFSAGLDDYQARYRATLAPSTVAHYDSISRALRGHFGKVRIDAIDRRDLREYFNKLDTSDKNKRHHLNIIRKVLDRALEDGVIASSPADRFNVSPDKARAESKIRRGDVWSPEQVMALGARRPMWLFWAWTGLRVSEILALRWEHVNLAEGWIEIRESRVLGKIKGTKTEAGTRRVPLLPPAMEALLKQRAVSEMARSYVWGWRDERGQWQGFKAPAGLSLRLKRDCKALELPYKTPRMFRHTFASLMVNAGEDIYWTAKIMGHAKPSITMTVYADFMPEAHAGKGGAAVAQFWEGRG